MHAADLRARLCDGGVLPSPVVNDELSVARTSDAELEARTDTITVEESERATESAETYWDASADKLFLRAPEMPEFIRQRRACPVPGEG